MPTIDFAIFNELSATEQATGVHQAIDWIKGLIDVMKSGCRLGFRRLKTRHDFRFHQLTDDERLIDVVSRLDRDRRNLIFSLLSSPYLEPADESAFLSFNVLSVADETRADAEGLLSGYVSDALVISFDTHVRWRTPEIQLGLEYDTTREIRSVDVRHASQATHVGKHIRWASRRSCSVQELTPRNDQPLPNMRFSDQLVNDDWHEFYSETSTLSAPEKTARLRTVAEDIAYMNGYDYCATRSARNSQRSGALRQIFVSKYTRPGHELYLSTDFEKAAGAFEVFDRNGRHLGEWLFSGSKNGDADGSGRHDIIVG